MTTRTHPFGTVLTAMVTPMRPDGEIDLEASRRLATYLVDHGNDGIVSGAGSNDTAHAVMMASQAEKAGAHGILALTPYYSRPSQRGVVAHIDAIAAASDLPIMLYDIPGRTCLAMRDESFDVLATRDTIVAMKDGTGDVAQAKARIERTGLAWYSGDDPYNLEFLRAGGVGVVSVATHVMGDTIARMVAAHHAGDDHTAQELHDATAPVIEAIMGAGVGAVMAKAALQAMGVLNNRHMRLPHLEASPEEYDELIAALGAAGIPLSATGD